MAQVALRCTFAFAAVLFSGAANAQSTEMVSVSPQGLQGNGTSYVGSISSNGRFVSFTSSASNLVPNDTNGTYDEFLRDLITGQTVRVSVATNGAEGAGPSAGGSSVSMDGRFVAFASQSPHLVPADANFDPEVLVRDLLLGTTTNASVALAGPAHGGDSPTISADGRYVSFRSTESLVPQDGTTGSDGCDVYVRDLVAGITILASATSAGTAGNGRSEAPKLSRDGRFVAFVSLANDLVANDTNGQWDGFVRDIVAGTTTRVTVGPSGEQLPGGGNALCISSDGHFVVLAVLDEVGKAGGTSTLVRRDSTTGALKSVGLNFVFGGPTAISDDGRYVSIVTGFAGPPQPDIYVRDMLGASFVAVDVAPDGGPPNEHAFSYPSAISADGRFVAFNHLATNLVTSPGDSNQTQDVFVRDTFIAPPPPPVWGNLGSSLAGSFGPAALVGTGTLESGSLVILTLSSAKPFSPSTLVVGVSALSVPFKGGVMVPNPNFAFPLLTDFFGGSSFGGLWPAGVPSGFETYFQWWIQDPGGPKGFAASNALKGTTP